MSNAKKINLLPGDYLFREGEFGQTAFIIEAGTIELVKFTGEEHTVLTELKKARSLERWRSLTTALEALQRAPKLIAP